MASQFQVEPLDLFVLDGARSILGPNRFNNRCKNIYKFRYRWLLVQMISCLLNGKSRFNASSELLYKWIDYYYWSWSCSITICFAMTNHLKILKLMTHKRHERPHTNRSNCFVSVRHAKMNKFSSFKKEKSCNEVKVEVFGLRNSNHKIPF